MPANLGDMLWFILESEHRQLRFLLGASHLMPKSDIERKILNMEIISIRVPVIAQR